MDKEEFIEYLEFLPTKNITFEDVKEFCSILREYAEANGTPCLSHLAGDLESHEDYDEGDVEEIIKMLEEN